MNEQINRVQLSRAKGWRMPPDAIKCDRSTQWGNRFAIIGPVRSFDEKGVEHAPFWHIRHYYGLFSNESAARTKSLELYAEWLAHADQVPFRNRIRRAFAKRRPACWCRHDQACHADLIAMVARTPVEFEDGAAFVASIPLSNPTE
jgi:hypothetical protein